MKKIRPGNILIRGLFVLSVAFAATGCLKETLTECYVPHSLIVKVYDADGKDMTYLNEISDVYLYIFDDTGFFVKRIETVIGVPVVIDVPTEKHIKVVGWSNASGTNDIFPEFISGEDHIGDCLIGLQSDLRSAHTVCNSPEDMFHGVLAIESGDLESEHILPIKRKTGSMNITARNLREFRPGSDDGDFSIVVRETMSHIGFEGGLMGERTAAYRPAGMFNPRGVYMTGMFRMLPDPDGVSIEIYHGSELLRTVDTCAGQPITVAEGVTTNILLDFSTTLDVRVSVTEWGIMEIWKDF